jgi:hypothetical protein
MQLNRHHFLAGAAVGTGVVGWRGAGTAEASTRQSMVGLQEVLAEIGA